MFLIWVAKLQEIIDISKFQGSFNVFKTKMLPDQFIIRTFACN